MVDMSTLTRKVGPLPVYGYVVIGGGVVMLIAAKRGHPLAAAATNPNTITPAAPGDPGAGVTQNQPAQPGQVVGVGQQVYNPNTGSVTPAVSITDLLGGTNVKDLIGSLGADYTNFNLSSGGTAVNVDHSAQNILDAQQAINYQKQVTDRYGIQTQGLTDQQRAWYDYSNHQFDTYAGAYTQNLAASIDWLNRHPGFQGGGGGGDGVNVYGPGDPSAPPGSGGGGVNVYGPGDPSAPPGHRFLGPPVQRPPGHRFLGPPVRGGVNVYGPGDPTAVGYSNPYAQSQYAAY